MRSRASCVSRAPRQSRWPISATCSRVTIRSMPSSKRGLRADASQPLATCIPPAPHASYSPPLRRNPCRDHLLLAPSIETRTSWLVAGISVTLLSLSFGSLWINAVGLKSIAADLGGSRSAPSLANSLAWFGSSVGGLAMGRLAERYGIRWTVLFGGVSVCIGLFISTLGQPWQLYVGHGIFMGLLGNSGLNAPLYVYVSRWFDRRRGSALALISSGSYLAGTVWPPIFERAIALFGWQATMVGYGLFAIALIIPLALLFLPEPPELTTATTGAASATVTPKVFGWPPNVVFA